MKALPKYQSHKVVSAAPIAGWNSIEGQVHVEFVRDGVEIYETVAVPVDFWDRFKPTADDTGYIVIYDNEYISWSPTKIFENGYSLIDETASQS